MRDAGADEGGGSPVVHERKLACADRLMPRMRQPYPRPPNGADPKLHGQGLRGYGSAARRMPACESRDAGGVTP